MKPLGSAEEELKVKSWGKRGTRIVNEVDRDLRARFPFDRIRQRVRIFISSAGVPPVQSFITEEAPPLPYSDE